MRRRTYLAAVSGTGVAGVAGCMGLGDSGSESDAEAEGDDATATDDDPPPLEGADDAGTVDDFTDLEPWSVVAGSATAVEDDAARGGQSVRLAAGEDDDQVRLVRELPEPVDWTGSSPGLAVATDEPITPIIQLFDDGGNVIDFRTTVHATADPRRCNFGVAGIDDDADLGAITEIHVASFAGDAERELLLDDLHLVPRPDDGLVMLQFDGGHESVADALPILEDHGYPATAFVTTDLIRAEADHDGDRLTEAQLAELTGAGWTIASHTANGRLLPDLAPDEQADQLREAREWLDEEGYDGARYVSYPTGRYDATALEAAEAHYDLGFAGRYPVQGQAADLLRYPRVVDPDVEEVAEVLELTAELGGITTLCYYRLEDEAADRFEETIEILAEHVSAGDLEVIMPRDVEAEYVFDPE